MPPVPPLESVLFDTVVLSRLSAPPSTRMPAPLPAAVFWLTVLRVMGSVADESTLIPPPAAPAERLLVTVTPLKVAVPDNRARPATLVGLTLFWMMELLSASVPELEMPWVPF